MAPQDSSEIEVKPVHVYRVVIAGARHVPLDIDDLTEELRKVLNDCVNRLGSIWVLSMGCDVGVGQVMKALCLDEEIPFTEVAMFHNQFVQPLYKEVSFLGRHSAFLDLGEEFHIVVTAGGMANIQDLAERAIEANLPVNLYMANGYYLTKVRQQDAETVIRPLA